MAESPQLHSDLANYFIQICSNWGNVTVQLEGLGCVSYSKMELSSIELSAQEMRDEKPLSPLQWLSRMYIISLQAVSHVKPSGCDS